MRDRRSRGGRAEWAIGAGAGTIPPCYNRTNTKSASFSPFRPVHAILKAQPASRLAAAVAVIRKEVGW